MKREQPNILCNKFIFVCCSQRSDSMLVGIEFRQRMAVFTPLQINKLISIVWLRFVGICWRRNAEAAAQSKRNSGSVGRFHLCHSIADARLSFSLYIFIAVFNCTAHYMFAERLCVFHEIQYFFSCSLCLFSLCCRFFSSFSVGLMPPLWLPAMCSVLLDCSNSNKFPLLPRIPLKLL